MKSPKIYFVDTGLMCSLLEIHSSKQLSTHYARGNIFENWVVGEYMKSRYNRGLPRNAYFWRDHIGNEVDLVIEEADDTYPVEVKSGATVNSDFYSGIKYYTKLSEGNLNDGSLVYGGEMTFNSINGRTIGWRDLPKLWQ